MASSINGTSTGNGGLISTGDDSGILNIQTNETTAITIDASQNVGIGTSSPAAKLDVRGSSSFLINATNPTAWVSVDSALTTGAMYNQFNTTSNIGITGTYTNHAHTFVTNNTERMRIDSSGNLLVGTTANAITAYSASKSLVQSADYSGAVAQLINSTSTTGTQYFLAFGRGASVCGQITSGATNSTTYATSSDYRLKKDVQPMKGALAKVQALKPCTYKWIEDDTTSEGFIAHELAEVCPDAVVGEKDAVNAEGNPVYQGVDTSFLVATLTAAIQEQQALITAQSETITALTARVVALEGK